MDNLVLFTLASLVIFVFILENINKNKELDEELEAQYTYSISSNVSSTKYTNEIDILDGCIGFTDQATGKITRICGDYTVNKHRTKE